MESGNEKTSQERLKENVIRGNEEFLLDLENAQSIDDVIVIVQNHTYVENGEQLIFEVGTDEEGNPDMTQAFPVDEFISTLTTLKNDPPTDALAVDEWIDHKDINATLKRVLNLS